ncbi:conserved protein of unknown function [Nitrosotalea devaniterrae]|uniref:Uncharacterized protein n=1 Tax=Nitrosotalea devaniterrae TaxID=1078905 RepID=A0A128A3D1_9ARCH|nr:conserved protein of unknown function [Candidatus Nitrosotalea devanaterra]
MGKVIEVVDPERINRVPDKTIVLMSGGNFLEQGHVVKNVSLNLYIQKKDEKLGPFSLITVLVETDKGLVEMTYDEGYRGVNAIEEAATFLTSHIGISGLILRSVMQLDQSMDKNNLLVLQSDDQDVEFYEV